MIICLLVNYCCCCCSSGGGGYGAGWEQHLGLEHTLTEQEGKVFLTRFLCVKEKKLIFKVS
jgi:hypothetical protein